VSDETTSAATTDYMTGIDARIRRLEDVAFEGEGLTRAVDRLGLNADALSEAILTVDRNQQKLTQLGTELTEVRTRKADTVDVDDRMRWERRRARTQLLGGFTLVTAMLLIGLFTLSEASHDACERRQESTRTNILVLEGFKEGADANGIARLDEGIDRYRATLDRSCDEQYWLHFP
jgi:hypothetical protein